MRVCEREGVYDRKRGVCVCVYEREDMCVQVCVRDSVCGERSHVCERECVCEREGVCHVHLGTFLRTVAQGTASQIAQRDCSKGERKEPGYV